MTSELRHAQKAEARGVDAVFSMRENDLPVKAREYARNLHGQVQDIYARLGVTSTEEISALPRTTLRRHMKDMGRLQPLLSQLREALTDPDLAEHRVDEAVDLEWHETVAKRLSERAERAASLWANDQRVGMENALGALRFKNIVQSADDEGAREDAREMLANLRTLNGQLAGLNDIVICAYDIGETVWAAAVVREEGLKNDRTILEAEVKACARTGDVATALATLRRGAETREDWQRAWLFRDMLPVVYAAAEQADDAQVIADVLSIDDDERHRKNVFRDAFTLLIDARDYTSAARLATWSGEPALWKELLQARYEAGEDVRREMLDYFAMHTAQGGAGIYTAVEKGAWAVERLRAYPDDIQRCYANLVEMASPHIDSNSPFSVSCAIQMANLAVHMGQDPAPFLVMLQKTFPQMDGVHRELQAGTYAALLYRAGKSDEARALADTPTNRPRYRAEARVKLVTVMVQRGDYAEVNALLDGVQQDLRADEKEAHEDYPVMHREDIRYEALLCAVAANDHALVRRCLSDMSSGLVKHANELVQLFEQRHLPGKEQILDAVRVHGPGAVAEGNVLLKDVRTYILFTQSVTGVAGPDVIEDYDALSVDILRGIKKSDIVRVLWEGAADAAKKAQQLRKAGGL